MKNSKTSDIKASKVVSAKPKPKKTTKKVANISKSVSSKKKSTKTVASKKAPKTIKASKATPVSIATEPDKLVAEIPKTENIAAEKPAKNKSAKKSKPEKNKLSKTAKISASGLKQNKLYKYTKAYYWASILALFATTLYWAYLGARYQLANADQLVNSMLFNSTDSVKNALLPQAHSFLIKWPLFLISGLLGSKPWVLASTTIILCLVTVGSLAYILRRIEKRPVIIGTIFFVLASMLLMIPTAPYSGALLPLNMAMFATRNIEYILFILGLYLVIKSQKSWRGWPFVFAIFVLSLLFATDKLFVPLSLGGAIAVIGLYSLARKWRIVKIGVLWLNATILSVLLSTAIIWAIVSLKITHIVSTAGLGPYNLVTSLREFAVAIIYAVFGVFSNFGANPAYDAVQLNEIPSKLKTNLLSIGVVGYIINITFLLVSIYFALLFIRASLTTKVPAKKTLPAAPLLSIFLMASSVVAFGIFILSNHYYPVDARYLAIIFFSLVITATTYVKSTNPKSLKPIAIIGLLVAASLLTSSLAAYQTNKRDIQATEPLSQRNQTIAKALKNKNLDYLAGDYWRVVPIAQQYKKLPVIAPLASCTSYRQVLTSTQWQPDLKAKSFAYILSLDKSATDFPSCTITDVTRYYGKPNSSILIDGSIENPKEILLIYNNGKTAGETSIGDFAPKLLSSMQAPSCDVTDMNIIAHQDDDILFMNPDVQQSINAGHCIRSVYLTAGDAGHSTSYWLKRERGAEAAYSQMANIPKTSWNQATVKVSDKAYIVVATPESNPKISLIFLRLPDGGIYGNGFKSTDMQSLASLSSGGISQITTVDKQSVYTDAKLQNTLADIISHYQPSTIRTQSGFTAEHAIDHADHIAVSKYAKDAIDSYASESQASVNTLHYTGYPVRIMNRNIDDATLDQKLRTFLAYAQNDGAVCQTVDSCIIDRAYGNYLTRQYYQ